METSAEPQWLSREERQSWPMLAGMMIRLPSALDAQLRRDAGLSHFEYMVLAGLSAAPERTRRMSDLASFAESGLKALKEANFLTATGTPSDPAPLTVNRTPPCARDLIEADQLAADLFASLRAQPVLGHTGLGLMEAGLGNVAHEVGTLRMAGDGSGVVDADLKFLVTKTILPVTTQSSLRLPQPIQA